MVLKVTPSGVSGGVSDHDALRSLAQTVARITTSARTALTDSSGGGPGTTINILASDFTDVAASGSSLAGKATTETQYNLVKDALLEVAVDANAACAAIGLSHVS
jgi:hypothetical protein